MSKKLSGAEVRKRAKERQEKAEKYLSKVPKLCVFFQPQPKEKEPCSSTSNVSPSEESVSCNVDVDKSLSQDSIVICENPIITDILSHSLIENEQIEKSCVVENK